MRAAQNRLNRGRQLEVLNRAHEPIGPAFPREHSRVDKDPHAFLQEEGIALRALDQEAPEVREGRVRPKERVKQLLRGCRRQRVEPDLLVVRLVPPPVHVLGPVVHQQKNL